MDKMTFIPSVIVITITVVVLASIIRAMLNRSRTVRQLREAEWSREHKKMKHAVVATLPKPVQQYLEHVIKEGTEQIRFARIHQQGEWRALSQPEWGKLNATAYYTGTIPGIVWHAKIRSSMFMWTDAQLLYNAGRGSGNVKYMGMVTLFDPQGPEVATALLSRILMEAVWFPTSLIPSGQMRWEAVDATSAKATLQDHGVSISATFFFNERNEVERIVTRDKYRDAETAFEREQCTMYCSEYKEYQGIKIPTNVRIEWNLDEEDFEYARITVDSAVFE